MPRKKHAFINRAKARTFQVVHRNGKDGVDRDHDAFVPVDEKNVTDSQYKDGHEIDISDFTSTYKKGDYELGEFGFPDDGYDYSQHFKTIGGGGGVFMDAVTAMPNPDAVSHGPSNRSQKSNVTDSGAIVLKDEVENEEKDLDQAQYTSQDDLFLRQQAMEEIRLERKKNKDLDEIFAALDSDGELDSTSNNEDEVQSESVPEDILALLGEAGELLSDTLEDDFIALANGDNDFEEEVEDLKELDGIVEGFREPRLLDEQFERFMRGYELSEGETDEDEFPGGNAQDIEEELNLEVDENEVNLDELWKDEALLGNLSALNISGSIEEDALEGGNESELQLAETVTEYEEIAQAEFERGMKGLLDSYNRIPAEEALGTTENVNMALNALKRAEKEEQDRLDRLDGFESDGHDSELDRQFDEMFKEPEEKWDCETILSTYSNLENHPSVIDAPASNRRHSAPKQSVVRLDPRTQIPVDYMPSIQNTGPRDNYGSQRDAQENTAQGRDRGESRDDKRARKTAAKDAARERRMLKKEMKKAFGTERMKQNRHATAMGKSKVTIQF